MRLSIVIPYWKKSYEHFFVGWNTEVWMTYGFLVYHHGWKYDWNFWMSYLISLRRYHQRSVTNQLGALDLIMHQGGQLNQAVTARHHIVRCCKTKDRTVLGTHCLIFFGDQTLKNVTARTQTFHLQMGDLTMELFIYKNKTYQPTCTPKH